MDFPSERRIGDPLELDPELLPRMVVTRDRTGDGLIRVDRLDAADGHVLLGADSLPVRAVVELDEGWSDGVHLADQASEVAERPPAGAAEKDVAERVLLLLVCALIEVKGGAPGRAGLVVFVGAG